MRTLNVKRISAIAAGAALLGVGLAFAGPITFQNVPIISNSGQPVVQIVIGSTAQPLDGVSAANIAAAIGNLAYTSVPVTASVNQTQAASVLHATLGTGATYSLANQQVWLNETGTTSVSGSYSFTALIGSVLNRALQLNVPYSTKSLQAGGSQYAYSSATSISTTLTPAQSPYTGVGVPINTTPNYNINGGGVSIPSSGATFTGSSNGDNILRVDSTELPGLMNNAGNNGESEYLWVTGFPVFVQQTSSQAGGFALLSAGGAYQVTFAKPLALTTSNGGANNAEFTLLGQNWTLLGGRYPSSSVGQNYAVAGGNVTLASSLTPLTTVYVGHNLTSGSFVVSLEDLGQSNSAGVSPASLAVYYNGQLTNTTSVYPGNIVKFNVTGHILDVKVNQTFAGLYAYQKWAKMQVYSNVYNLRDGNQFNSTLDKGWNVKLWWTNATSSSGTANELYSIIMYNSSPETITPGKSIAFIQNPVAYKFTFVGDTLSNANFDPVTLTTSSQSTENYQNLGTVASGLFTIQNVTEPAQLLTVASQIPNAFTTIGPTTSSVLYDLTPYTVASSGNSLTTQGFFNPAQETSADMNTVVTLSYTGPNAANWITSTYPLQVVVNGHEFTGTAGTYTNQTQQVSFTSNSANIVLPIPISELVGTSSTGGIKLSKALPGTLTVNVITYNGLSNFDPANMVALGKLSNAAPGVLYTPTGNTNLWQEGFSQTAATNTLYNDGGSGSLTNFYLNAQTPSYAPTTEGQYFTFTMNEIAVPNSGTQYQDGFIVGLDNTTAGVGASNLFQLNYSATSSGGNHNNVTYDSTQGHLISVMQGFRSEGGSKVTSITPGSVTISFAKAVDELQFAVGPANATTITHNFKLWGPYSVGQATNLPNVSIGSVTANVTVGGSTGGATVTGISQIQAVPSVSQADQPVLLNGLGGTSPLVVLDSQANPQSNLILIGSGFVNTLSEQLQSSYNISMTPSTQIMQAYGTNRILIAGYTKNQTQAAADSFIQQLYSQASTV